MGQVFWVQWLGLYDYTWLIKELQDKVIAALQYIHCGIASRRSSEFSIGSFTVEWIAQDTHTAAVHILMNKE